MIRAVNVPAGVATEACPFVAAQPEEISAVSLPVRRCSLRALTRSIRGWSADVTAGLVAGRLVTMRHTGAELGLASAARDSGAVVAAIMTGAGTVSCAESGVRVTSRTSFRPPSGVSAAARCGPED